MSMKDLLAKQYWSEREGRAAVALWRQSGLSPSKFCARTGLRHARLTYWSRRIAGATGRTGTAITLVPVTVVPARRGGSIAIELLSGRTIRIEDDVDDALLARVIAVAEQAGC